MDTQKVNGQIAAGENTRQGTEVASVREPAVDGGVANVREEEGVQGAREVEEPSEADQINASLDQGYRVRQIIQMGFKRQTVALYASKRMAPEGNKAKATKASLRRRGACGQLLGET